MLSLRDNPPALWPPHARSIRDFAVSAGGADTGGADAAAAAADAPRWWVAHTKARFEKAFAADLAARGVGYFLPMVRRTRVDAGRRHAVLLPLFPSYVFFFADAAGRHVALSTGRLCQVIAVADQGRLVRELEPLHAATAAALAGRVRIDPYPFAAVGRRCRIVAGALEGFEGVVVRRDGLTRLVMHVGILGQGAAVEIDADLLEPAGDDGDLAGVRAGNNRINIARPRHAVPA